MILKASQRGGASQLGAHLLKPENEHVELHEISGFVADDVMSAMKEAQAVARGTRCKQFLFSVSLNPPANENVPVDAFEKAIGRIEERTGLTGQPRIVIFHEKEGRRHAHCVWSRIDPETMTARPMSFFKTKLREVSKEIYLEHGWQMPRGLVDAKERDPRNFTLAEWQQAKRMGRDPTALKAAVQECWVTSDSSAAFVTALEKRGLYLARGDKRGHVVVTYEGEALSVARQVGKRTKEVAAKLGDPAALRGVEETRVHIGTTVAPRLEALIREADAKRAEALAPLESQRLAMRYSHRQDRQRLDDRHRLRQTEEAKARNTRLRRGIAGLWDRFIGKRAETIRQNEAEASLCQTRDRAERHNLLTGQLDERRGLQKDIRAMRDSHAAVRSELYRDLIVQRQGNMDERDGGLRSTFASASTGLRRTETARGSRDIGRERSSRLRSPHLSR